MLSSYEISFKVSFLSAIFSGVVLGLFIGVFSHDFFDLLVSSVLSIVFNNCLVDYFILAISLFDGGNMFGLYVFFVVDCSLVSLVSGFVVAIDSLVNLLETLLRIASFSFWFIQSLLPFFFLNSFFLFWCKFFSL